MWEFCQSLVGSLPRGPRSCGRQHRPWLSAVCYVCYHCERCRRMPQENGKRRSAGFGLSVCESHALDRFMRILRYTFYGRHGRPKVPHADASPDAQDVGLVIRHLSCFREFCCRQFAFVGFSCPAEKNKVNTCKYQSYRTRRWRKFQKYETYRRGWLLWIRDGRAKPLMDQKVLEVSSLSLSLSDYLPTYLPIYQSIYVPIYLSIYLSLSLSSI